MNALIEGELASIEQDKKTLIAIVKPFDISGNVDFLLP